MSAPGLIDRPVGMDVGLQAIRDSVHGAEIEVTEDGESKRRRDRLSASTRKSVGGGDRGRTSQSSSVLSGFGGNELRPAVERRLAQQPSPRHPSTLRTSSRVTGAV